MLVIDEADIMLSRWFIDQIYEIFKYLPEDLLVYLFSAAKPPDILEISDLYKKLIIIQCGIFLNSKKPVDRRINSNKIH